MHAPDSYMRTMEEISILLKDSEISAIDVSPSDRAKPRPGNTDVDVAQR